MARRRTTTNIFIFIPSAIYLTFLFLLVSLPMMLSFIPSFLLFSSRRVLVGHHHRFHRFLASSASSSSSVRGRRTSRSAASLDTVTGSAADPILDPLAVSSLLTSLSTPNTTTTPTTNNTTATTTTRRRKTKEVIADTTTTTATPLIITPSEEELSMDFGWEESSDVILFKKFQKEFLKKHHIQPYRTEWRIVAPDLSLGGSIDFLGKKIHPQTEEMGIVAFPPDIGEYHYLPVPNMEKEMKLLFEHFKRKCSTGGDIDMPID
eukprot:scaffold3715_cov249-Ochromonas_danica.AAC.3